MKKVLFLVLFALFIDFSLNAQYRVNRKLYDEKSYSHQPGDPYSPLLAGVGSAVIPGLGQTISGEPLRGAAFFGGFAGCLGILLGSASIMNDESTFFLIGSISVTGMGFIYFYSIIDAVKVAKINNLAFRDKGSASYHFKINPFVSQLNTCQNSYIPVGLTLTLNF